MNYLRVKRQSQITQMGHYFCHEIAGLQFQENIHHYSCNAYIKKEKMKYVVIEANHIFIGFTISFQKIIGLHVKLYPSACRPDSSKTNMHLKTKYNENLFLNFFVWKIIRFLSGWSWTVNENPINLRTECWEGSLCWDRILQCLTTCYIILLSFELDVNCSTITNSISILW